MKQPKINMFPFEAPPSDKPITVVQKQKLDTMWLLSSNFCSVPLWRGWNAVRHKDKLPQQKVTYLSSIRLPPTRRDVVLGTMKQAQLIAQEMQ